ncbi:class II aldolase/adducin family protein [bacterium]|nr:class II aldolase/adducin family protein [bacterium]
MNEIDGMHLRAELIEVGQRLDQRTLISGTEGNVSVRLGQDSILITQSGTMLGRLMQEDFVRVGLSSGELLDKHGKPTSELGAHLSAYRSDPNIQAIVHAHPRSCVALTLRGWTLEGIPLPEAAYAIGSVPTCAFAVPGSDEGGEVMAQWAAKRDALVFDRHGAFTFGKTPFEAQARMEMLDAVAQSVLLAGGPDQLRPMTTEQVDRVVANALKSGVREDSLRAWADAVKLR